jgi:hypothetical protein
MLYTYKSELPKLISKNSDSFKNANKTNNSHMNDEAPANINHILNCWKHGPVTLVGNVDHYGKAGKHFCWMVQWH